MKRLCSILICVILLTAVLPVSAYAARTSIYYGESFTVEDLIYDGTLTSNGANKGTLAGNLTIEVGGALLIGSGFTLEVAATTGVINNAGTINDSGTIRNAGKIYNSGTIFAIGNGVLYNDGGGTIDYNTVTVTTNSGTITENTSSGVISLNTGTVENNFGQVQINNGTVTNNFGGTVGTYSAVRNYYKAIVTGEHTTNTLTAANGELWLESGVGATFSPEPGYVITNATSSYANARFTNSNGAWTLTATGAYTEIIPVTLTVEALPVSSVPHTGSDRQTPLMLSLALLSGAVLLSGLISRRKRA